MRCALDVAAASWLLEANDLDGAQRVLASALASAPHDVRARSMLAQVLVRRRDFVAASEVYERLLSEFRGDLTLTFNLALCHLKSGRNEAAAAGLRRILTVQTDHARARVWLRVAEAAAVALPPRTAPSLRGSVPPSRIDELPRVALPPTAAVAKDAAGIVSVRVEEGAIWFVRPEAVQGYKGDVALGARANENDRAVSLSGNGTAFLRAKDTLMVIELRDEEACVRASALVAHAATLALEATDREVVGEFDEDVLRLLGSGAIVLEASAELVTLPVGLTHATTVRWENVVGWTGHVIGAPSDTVGADGRALVRFAGNGSLLLSMHDEAASLPTANRGDEWYGRYQVLRRLEQTATEEVLLARSHGPGGFQRKVILRRHLSQYGGDSHVLELLAREADAHALLAHPGIVRLYDFLLLDGHPVLVLEYVSGVSLASMERALRAQHRTLSDSIALYIGHCVFSALAAVHAARDPDSGEVAPVFHRDVRPETVLLGWNGDVKLASFATAKVSGALAMSADLYVGSALLHELLVRGRAGDGARRDPTLDAETAEPSPEDLDVLRPDLSPRLREALRVALSPDPEGHAGSAADMVRAIESAVDLTVARKQCTQELLWLRESAFGATRSSRPPPPMAGTADAAFFTDLRFPKPSPVPRIAPESTRPSADTIPDSPNAEVPTTRRSLAAPPPLMSADTAPPVQPASLGPSALHVDAQRVRRSRRRMAAAISGAGIVVGVGAVTWAPWSTQAGRASGTERHDEVVELAAEVTLDAGSLVVTVAATSATPTASVEPASVAPAATAAPIAPGEGILRTPARAAQHRVFFDGRTIGEGSGEYRVPCGKHSVRIGSKGDEAPIDVPCGGSIDVD